MQNPLSRLRSDPDDHLSNMGFISRASIEADNIFKQRYDSKLFSLKPITLLEDSSVEHSGKTMFHIANFTPHNAGDRLLSVVVRDSFSENIGAPKWKTARAHREVTPSLVRRINRGSGVVIGGGGLFLRDTNENALSGWQWSCSVDNLEQISAPIAVLAVGYNRFRHQPDFEPIFRTHIETLARKSKFIGLRNNGSVNAIRSYLPEDLQEKVVLHPCPTTILGHLYPFANRAPLKDVSRWSIALNCAFDRRDLRYQGNEAQILERIAQAMRILSNNFPIRFYSHTYADSEMLPYLDRARVPYKVYRLEKRSPRQIVEAYSDSVITIGMRGHSQMIPVGCGRPIISLASHDKLLYFLEDVQAPDWGIDIHSDDLDDQIIRLVDKITDNIDSTLDRVCEIRRNQMDITVENFRKLKQDFE